MTDTIAIYTGEIILYWSSIIICLAIAAWFFLSLALYAPNGGRTSAMWVFLPIACALSLFFSRAIHWYCHTEQYASFASAFQDFSVGSYDMPGVFLGVVLAALLVRLLRFSDSAPKMFDALAPGMALGLAIIRLSFLFNNADRGKVIVTTPAYQRLPIAATVTGSVGAVEYHFATFFVQCLLLLLLSVLMLFFYYHRRKVRMKSGSNYGHTAMMFLLFYSAMEIVLDSTRYDSSFLRSNGFVSLVQIVSALSMLGIMVYYSVHSIKANGLKFYHWIFWVLFLGSAGGVGYLEYLVQRHGDWYMKCYAGMSACCFLMAMMVYGMYRTVCVKRKKKVYSE